MYQCKEHVEVKDAAEHYRKKWSRGMKAIFRINLSLADAPEAYIYSMRKKIETFKP